MYRAAVTIFICITLIFTGCLNGNEKNGGSQAQTMTMQEYLGHYHQRQNSATKTMVVWLDSLDQGDTVIINDTIQSINYNVSANQSGTIVTFSSVNSTTLHQGGLKFEGDITDSFAEGDNVTVTVHIANVTFYQTLQPTGETWKVHYELFEEQWDRANDTEIPLPQRCIKHAAYF